MEKFAITRALEGIGFTESDSKKDLQSFGDYYTIYFSPEIEIRLGRSRSVEMMDIRSITEMIWFDLALVKALLYNEGKLNEPSNIKELHLFLIKEIDRIKELFNHQNYFSTKEKLSKLERARVNLMFGRSAT
ncbi:MAG TPA: hypothetical protein VF490_09885 [Chryseosolibacter sp.]